MVKKKAIGIMLAVFILNGCASSIPLRSNLNDFVTIATKTTSQTVTYECASNIQDGKIQSFKKDRQVISGQTYVLTETAVFNRMIKEYMGNKFTSQPSDADTKIIFMLTDFWLEEYSTDSGLTHALVALGGGE